MDKDAYFKKCTREKLVHTFLEKLDVTQIMDNEMTIIRGERNKAQRYLREAKGAFLDALDVLGRDNNTDAFIRHISERNAALWRWKHTQGERPSTKEEWI